MDFVQFIGLVLVTMGGTSVLKALVNKLGGSDPVLRGNVARYLSLAVAAGLTAWAWALGIVDVPAPASCTADAIVECSGSWLTWGAGVAAVANIAYEQVWSRLKDARSGGEAPPAAPAAAPKAPQPPS